MYSLSWTLELSPPASGWPHVTTRFRYGSICQNCRVATNLLNWHQSSAPMRGLQRSFEFTVQQLPAVSINRSLESSLENLLDSSETSTSWPQSDLLCSDLQVSSLVPNSETIQNGARLRKAPYLDLSVNSEILIYIPYTINGYIDIKIMTLLYYII